LEIFMRVSSLLAWLLAHMVPTGPVASLPVILQATFFTLPFTVPDLHPSRFPSPAMMV
jgi:hypothetical protein